MLTVKKKKKDLKSEIYFQSSRKQKTENKLNSSLAEGNMEIRKIKPEVQQKVEKYKNQQTQELIF